MVFDVSPVIFFSYRKPAIDARQYSRQLGRPLDDEIVFAAAHLLQVVVSRLVEQLSTRKNYRNSLMIWKTNPKQAINKLGHYFNTEVNYK